MHKYRTIQIEKESFYIPSVPIILFDFLHEIRSLIFYTFAP